MLLSAVRIDGVRVGCRRRLRHLHRNDRREVGSQGKQQPFARTLVAVAVIADHEHGEPIVVWQQFALLDHHLQVRLIGEDGAFQLVIGQWRQFGDRDGNLAFRVLETRKVLGQHHACRRHEPNPQGGRE